VATKDKSLVVAADECLTLSVKAAAKRIGCGPDRVYELVAAGRLRSIKLGKRNIRIPRDAVSDWLTAESCRRR
jgi:excisionase family DNA binding protein